MEVKVLGVYSPYAVGSHNCPGFLVTDGEDKIMLDCGSGTHKLLHFPSDLNNLSVILTHLHGDHYSDIRNIQYASFVYHNLKRIRQPIQIYLPGTPYDKWEDVVEGEHDFADYHLINEKTALRIGNVEIRFCPTAHPIETYAIKLSCNGKTIVYTADTSFLAKDRLVKFAQNADLLISESSLLTSYGFPEITSHLTAKQAASIAKEANVKELLLTHFWPEESSEKYVEEARSVFPHVSAAEEGQVIDLC